MSLSFLTPLAALVGLLGVLALAVARRAARRSEALCARLGLEPAPARHRAVDTAALAAFAVLLALAAAQPVLSRREAREGREGVQVVAIVDITRSMLARRAPSEPTRLERARSFAKEVRAELPELEFGVVSLTDRVLPHLFPTLGANAFAATVDRAIGIERPPPDRDSRRATALGAIADMARLHFFGDDTYRRIALVLTDGETLPVDLAAFRDRIVDGRVSTIFVQVWRADERIFDEDSAVLAGYKPDPTSVRSLRRVSGAIDGGLYTEGQAGAVAAEIRRIAGEGPQVPHGRELRSITLAPYAIALAFLPLLLLLRRRNL